MAEEPAVKHPRSRLDEIDKKIIRILQTDGRMQFSKLGPLVDLSPAAARQRVLQLIEDDVISFVAVTDPTATGQLAQAMVGIKVQGDIDRVLEGVEAHPEVVYLVLTAGRFDLLAEIVCTNTDRLMEVLQGIRMQTGVLYAEVFTYLRLAKQTYNWGVS
ncbi:MAG TPA: Lrp/AsnC family transcriptional regulator [Acidimicrobiia bacterium]|nr:Lrp/AsnC family transcriptional regulator [Acidimicrobiia bacterium]